MPYNTRSTRFKTKKSIRLKKENNLNSPKSIIKIMGFLTFHLK